MDKSRILVLIAVAALCLGIAGIVRADDMDLGPVGPDCARDNPTPHSQFPASANGACGGPGSAWTGSLSDDAIDVHDLFVSGPPYGPEGLFSEGVGGSQTRNPDVLLAGEQAIAVTEPGTLMLLGLGLLAVGIVTRKSRRDRLAGE